jgi:hypothetical protein
MLAVMQAVCGEDQAASQSNVCGVISKSCPNFTLDCENQMGLRFACDIHGTTKAALQVMAAEPEAVQKALLGQATANSTLEETVTQRILTGCGDEDRSTQTIKALVRCEDSNGVVIQAMNRMDTLTACVTSIVASMVAEARETAANAGTAAAKKQPLSNTAVMLIVLGVGFLAGLAALLGIWLRPAGSGAAPAAPSNLTVTVNLGSSGTGTGVAAPAAAAGGRALWW